MLNNNTRLDLRRFWTAELDEECTAIGEMSNEHGRRGSLLRGNVVDL